MKSFISALLLTISCFVMVAQVPQGINYQTVVRNSSGSALVNTNVGIKINIRSGSASGTVVYSETHVKTTNSLGLINLVIGQGTVVTGTFSSINWGNNSYFAETLIDVNGGTSYVSLGAQQLMSVPYALYADSSGTPGPQGPVGPQGPAGNNFGLYQQKVPVFFDDMEHFSGNRVHSTVSESNGATIYICYQKTPTSQTRLTVSKLLRDAVTGKYMAIDGASNDFGSMAPIEISGITVFGDYLYTYGYISGNYRFSQLNKNLTGSSVLMNVLGFYPDNSSTTNRQKVMFSDNNFIYIFNNINTGNCVWKKYSVSGTDLTDQGVFIVNNLGAAPEAAVYDNGFLYMLGSNGQNLYKINFSNGQVVSTTTLLTSNYFFGEYNSNNGGLGLSLTSQSNALFILSGYKRYINVESSSDINYLDVEFLPISKP